MKRWIGYSTITSLLLAVGYGLLLRYLAHSEPLNSVLVTLSFAFLVLGPLAMGALAVWFAPLSMRREWGAVLRIGAALAIDRLVAGVGGADLHCDGFTHCAADDVIGECVGLSTGAPA